MPLPSDNPLTFRTDDMGRWGLGSGAGASGRLTKLQADMNFWELLLMVAELQSNPALPAEIDNIAVSNGQITITLTNAAVFGPFDLPEQAFRWTGEFVGATDYQKFDVFTKNNNLYLVLQAHTAASTFDPAASNMSGQLYALMFPYQNVYDAGFFYPGLVGNGLAVDDAMFVHIFARDVYLPAGLLLSKASFEVLPADVWTVDIYKNDELIGDFTFDPFDSTSDYSGVFTFLDDVQFNAGDKLRLIRPAVIDAAASGFALTFVGARGTI